MDTNVYIGARYVPKFASPIEWSSVNTYEPLTIVTHQGASYTSKTFVPAGIELTNTDYWVVTGNYNAQIEAYRQTVQEMSGDVAYVKDYVDRRNRKYIFIGDSYDQYGGWVNKCASMLGLKSNQFWNIAAPSTSFSDGEWLVNLQNWVAENPDEVKNIGTIVCGGGINDSSAERYPSLATALFAFREYVNTTFGSDVAIKLGYFGWALAESPILYNRVSGWRVVAQQLYARAGSFGMEYLNGCEMVLHDRSLMDSDGLHPNAEGGKQIAEAVVNAMLTGYATIHKGKSVTVTPNSGTVAGSIRQEVFNGMVSIRFIDFGVNGSYTFSNGNYTAIGTCALPYGNYLPAVDTTTILRVGGVNKVYRVSVKVSNNTLYMAVLDVDDSSNYYNITATEIHKMNFSTCFVGMTD